MHIDAIIEGVSLSIWGVPCYGSSVQGVMGHDYDQPPAGAALGHLRIPLGRSGGYVCRTVAVGLGRTGGSGRRTVCWRMKPAGDGLGSLFPAPPAVVAAYATYAYKAYPPDP